uniref:Uncharacterized protein n=1 Tax=Zooxanthella nutricula TaxID=1333877 RepID=A0A7S2K2A1_9DINO
MYLSMAWDRRSFAVRALVKVTGVSILFIVVVPSCVGLPYENWWSHIVLAVVVYPATLALTAAGPARVAGVPWLGPAAVRLLMGHCRCHGAARKAKPTRAIETL